MTYEIAKKIVEAGDSKLFLNWHLHTGISAEDFLEGIKWLCEEPIRYPADDRNYYAAGRLRRELGIRRDGTLVHLKRTYGKGGACAIYEDKPGGALWYGLPSLSAADRI